MKLSAQNNDSINFTRNKINNEFNVDVIWPAYKNYINNHFSQGAIEIGYSRNVNWRKYIETGVEFFLQKGYYNMESIMPNIGLGINSMFSLDSKFSPFVKLSTGYNHFWKQKLSIFYTENIILGGLYFKSSVGLKCRVMNEVFLNLGLGYNFQRSLLKIIYSYSETQSEYKYWLNRIGIHAAIAF